MSPPLPVPDPVPAPSLRRATAKARWRRWWHILAKAWRGAVHLEDTPHRIALGSACGLACTYLPILGQMLVGMTIARLLRANVFASLPWTWITNPFTTVPIWYGCYRLGLWITPGRWADVSFERLRALIDQASSKGWRDGIGSIYTVLRDVYVPMFAGAVVLGGISALIGYVLIRSMVVRLQARRERRRTSWRAGMPTSRGA